MEALASVPELQARLPFTMSAEEQREATGALADLSDEARYYGSPRWQMVEDAPYTVVNMILRAAARHMKNYEGYVTNRAGDESVSWSERGSSPDEQGSARFSPEERKRLAEIGGQRRVGFHSVGMFAWQRRMRQTQEGFVPDEASSEPIQMFSSDSEPW